MTRWLAVALLGCGRIAFDPVSGDDSGGPPSTTPWALVQTRAADDDTLTVDPLGAQHLIIVAVQLDGGGAVTAITDSSNCNTYVAIPAAHATNADLEDDLEIFYAKDSCPGARQIRIAATMAVLASAAWEVSGIRTDDPLDTATQLNDQPASTTPLGPSITTSTAGEFVVSVAIVDNLVSGIHAGNEFTNDHITNGNAWAHLTDPLARPGIHQAQ